MSRAARGTVCSLSYVPLFIYESKNGHRLGIGLFDRGNNGLFNDSDDVVLIDRDGTGRLSYTDDTQVVAFDDVFSLGESRLEVAGADKYGTWLELRQTDRALTSLFSARRDSLIALQTLRGGTGIGGRFFVLGHRG